MLELRVYIFFSLSITRRKGQNFSQTNVTQKIRNSQISDYSVPLCLTRIVINSLKIEKNFCKPFARNPIIRTKNIHNFISKIDFILHVFSLFLKNQI